MDFSSKKDGVVLKQGDKGEAVATVQSDLTTIKDEKGYSYFTLPDTAKYGGLYGNATESAVSRYKEYKGIYDKGDSKGKVGDDTWAYLEYDYTVEVINEKVKDGEYTDKKAQSEKEAAKRKLSGKLAESDRRARSSSDKGTGNGDIVTTRLSNTDFLKITDGSIAYYGGDQDWFERYSQQFGGCGPTAAANILAYMAKTNPELAKLYGYDINNITRADFAKFMEDIYKYVTPLEVPILSGESDKKGSQVGIPSLGITSLSDFTKGVEKFAQSKGIILKPNWSSEKPTFDNAVSYIRQGLEKDKPVALLNMFNPVDMKWTVPHTQFGRHGKLVLY